MAYFMASGMDFLDQIGVPAGRIGWDEKGGLYMIFVK